MTQFGFAPLILEDELHPTVARVAQGLTLYLAGPAAWAGGGVLTAFDAFLAAVPQNDVFYYTSSMIAQWHPVTSQEGRQSLREALPAWSNQGMGQGVRHGFRFEYVDDPGAPTRGFQYREIDPARADRTPVLEITLPFSTPQETLLELAKNIAQAGDYWCGVGGYVARWNWMRKRLAFTQAYKWCGRWLGLDVQDGDMMAWHAKDGLPGTGWLTFIGGPFAARNGIGLDGLRAHPWQHGVTAQDVGDGLMVQAGTKLDAGDTNTLAFPEPYAESAKTLAPHFVQDTDEYWGMFGGRKHTNIWLRRWEDLTAWDERRA